jgi:hypothetical protein
MTVGEPPGEASRHAAEPSIFRDVADESAALVRVLAVFFGGQDHVRQMLLRLSAD